MGRALRLTILFFPMLLACANAAVESTLYEEDLLASAPIRVEQWRQFQAYIAALPEKKGPPLSPVPPSDSSVSSLRTAFRTSIGYPAPGFVRNPSSRFEKIAEDSIATYFRCSIRVAPQMDTYGLLIVPKNVKLPAPLVISQHGGGGFPEMATFHGGTNYHDLVRGAVAEGYVVWAPLTVMYPYRDRDHNTPIPADVRGILDDQLRARGATLMGVECYKLSRALDVILKRPEVDSTRVAMLGLSYGGFYTLYLTALDPRIKVAVASCSFRDKEPAGVHRNERPAGRPIDLGSAELVRLIAPRPLQVQDGIHDSGFPIENVRRAVAASRVFYAGPHESDFDFQSFEGAHEFRGEVAWPFLRKYLK
jgi:dienelactone hydrolase